MDERIFCGPRKRGKRKGKKGRNTLARVQSSPSTQSLVLATTTCEFRESKKKSQVRQFKQCGNEQRERNKIPPCERESGREQLLISQPFWKHHLCRVAWVRKWHLDFSLAHLPYLPKDPPAKRKRSSDTQKRMKSQKLLIRQNHGKQPGRRRRPSQWR